MKLLETYKNECEDTRDPVIKFIYKNNGFDGWMYKPKMCLQKYPRHIIQRACIYRITQTQGNSVA